MNVKTANVKTVKKPSTNQGVQVIARAAEILRVLKQDNGGLSLGQIAERVYLPRSTVQRIVNALLAERLVMTSSAESGLRLGPEIQTLALAGRINVAELIKPILTKLSRETGETVDLAVFRDDHMEFIDQVVGNQRLRTVSSVGERFPMTNTANGKAALALLDDETVAVLSARELRATDSDPKNLSTAILEIEQIRENGIAWDLNEHTDGISAIGLAFKDSNGVIYSVSLPVPTHRFASKKNELVESLQKARKSVQATL
jgi:DNA-binding IclR family transcriptional regulator